MEEREGEREERGVKRRRDGDGRGRDGERERDERDVKKEGGQRWKRARGRERRET